MKPGEADALKLTGHDHVRYGDEHNASLSALIAGTASAESPLRVARDALRNLSDELFLLSNLFIENGEGPINPLILRRHLNAMSDRAQAYAELDDRLWEANQQRSMPEAAE